MLGTTAIVGGVQKPLTPRDPAGCHRSGHCNFPTVDGATTLPNLVKLAQRWIDQSGLPEKDRVGRARYLERQLAASGQFQYSLVGQDRDPKHRSDRGFRHQTSRGHCEYFATALTLMLRSQGIPARMVVGYKCDEWNPVGGYYQVRQLHAHTWVEAYLQPDQIPPDLMHGGDYWHWKTNGGWLRLDPTPAGAGPQRQSSWFAPITTRWIGSIAAWSNYVMDLDAERQREAIYGPIARAARAVWREVDRSRAVAGHARRHAGHAVPGPSQRRRGLAGGRGRRDPRHGPLGRRRLAVLAASDAGCGPAGRETTAGRPAAAAQIEFYRRFETLLARQGILRAPGQTQREFAAAAGHATGPVGQRSAVGPPARRGGRGLLPRPFRRPAPRQSSGPGGRTCRLKELVGDDTMKIGLVGYQGSGKSTLFHWLTGVAPDPALAHTGQSAMAPIPDARFEPLCKIYHPKKVTHAAIELVDTPGLSRTHEGNATRMAMIREAGCLVFVVAAFDGTDPVADLRSFDEDLVLADMEIVANRIQRVEDSLKKPLPRPEHQQLEHEHGTLKIVLAAMEAGRRSASRT